MYERPLDETWDGLTQRFAPRQGQRLTAFVEGVVPVAVVARDETDTSRPLWHVTGFVTPAAGRHSGISITAAVDIAIERIDFWGTFDAFVLIGTPSNAFNLFEFPATFSLPGVRPRVDFNVGNVLCLQHENTGTLTPIGQSEPYNTDSDLQTAGGIFVNKLKQPVRRLPYPPPGLILPASMFLTVQSSGTGPAAQLGVTFVYRELGRLF